tara:strand:- start:5263 stop:7308 length:2046 start_codon:yes stop_codon:yes gene_type:complete
MSDSNFLLSDITTIKGVGTKTRKYLQKKKIEKVKDLLWDLPYSFIDRSKITSLNKLEIGKILTIKVDVLKYNFPRIRNLPNTVICGDESKKIKIVFFNSYEGYIRKILPLNKSVIISGKINYYKNSYQITNPTYIKSIEHVEEIAKIFPKYSLTEGLLEKNYRKLIEKVIKKIDHNFEWHDNKFLQNNNFKNLKETLNNLHNPESNLDIFSNDFRRLAYDEILSNLLTLYSARKVIKIKKKRKKSFKNKLSDIVKENFKFDLTKGQIAILTEINKDLKSDSRMFRLLQGDVGSGKTILALIAAANVLEDGFQVAFMAPTEILAKQHYELALDLFKKTKINISLLTSKIINADKDKILKNLTNESINFLFGTHSLFQKKIKFANLGFIIIDEQHKFGVKQRIKLAKKGGNNCDVLSMSATPIPRTMMLSFFGDMDISILDEKPKFRKEIVTLIKPENKINEIIPLIHKQIKLNYQVFWVCPLIDQSNKLDFTSAKKKFNDINKLFPNNVGLIHGNMNVNERSKILNLFLSKKIKILVSTTIIEVGINFPDANIIIIENSNKFGLSQLHQLRGRVGRGNSISYCILLYKKNLSQNAKKRLRILRETNSGFIIAEEDLKIRGHGDLLGFQQSGVKNFKFADPIHHKDLFLSVEKKINTFNSNSLKKYEKLIKLYDRADIINEIR